VPAWAELSAAPAAPLAGMLARFELAVGEAREVLAVPREALLWEGPDAYLFVRRPDGAFERRAVRAGGGDGRLVEIRGGLAEGEPVAVRGVADLQTGWAGLR
jgi:cobalt-zinc-cadmium efflux system membrane fusion protein